VGSLLSIFLAKKGFDVNVFEKRSDIRKAKILAGRSINLVVADRGWTALENAGIHDVIRQITVPVYGRMTHDAEGNQDFHQYSVEGKAIYSVSRAELNKRLIEIADDFDNVSFHFDHQCSGLSKDGDQASFINKQGASVEIEADVIFGADGANSEVRNCIKQLLEENEPDVEHEFREEYIEHGYKELIIPPDANGNWVLNESALHIWPRKQFMLMALANLDGGFTCTLFLPFKGPSSFETLQTKEELMSLFNNVFGDAVPLMPTLKNDFFENPTSRLVIVKCKPWIYRNRVALIGDAAHAVVPFYGEGMNSGFEDCDLLNSLIEKIGAKWDTVLPQYYEARKPNGDAIADLSLRNFVEMRDLVADPDFLFRKKIEARLQATFPEQWLPLYSQVKFTNIPYSEAWQEGLRQDEIMKKIVAIQGLEEKWEDGSFAAAVAHLI